ncbi:MAG: response regulator [Oligoflexia bacterium]|nr:response regulator [Oligoflexia bacterium]
MTEEDIYRNFCSDCDELLDEAEESLLNILKISEEKKELVVKKEHYTPILRSLHSIKGTSGMMGYQTLNKHTHHLEDLLLVVSKTGMNRSQCDYFIKEIDLIRAYLKNNNVAFSIKYSVNDFLELGINNFNDNENVIINEGNINKNQVADFEREDLDKEKIENDKNILNVNNANEESSTKVINQYKKDKVHNYFKRLPEEHIDTVKNILNETIEGIEIKQNLNLAANYYNTLTYVVSFENLKKSVKGAFILDFSDNTLPPIIANTIAKNMGLDCEFKENQDLIKDVLIEFFYTIIGKTISEWSTLGLHMELSPLISNEDFPDEKLPFKSDKVRYLYEILFHLSSGHLRFKIFFSEKLKESKKEHNKILIVDDSRTVRAALINGLKKENFIIEEASNGLEAIEKYKTFAPNLVIIDLIMPKLNGMDAIVKIREIDHKAKFIILSSITKREEEEKVKSLGVLCYITKPLHMSYILESINKINMDQVAIANSLEKEEVAAGIDFSNGMISSEDKIMVVDDSKTIRLYVSKNLKKEGMLVIEANNGKEAIEKFIEHRPNIVIMDLTMPVMSGFEAMREIRKMDNNVKFIVLTSRHQNEGDATSLQAVDISSYILKPFDIGQIIEDVKGISNLTKDQNKFSNKKILVVNKSKTLRHVMVQILIHEGFEIEIAGTGSEAVEKFKSFLPMLTIIDLNLPYLSGFDAIAQIRELNPEAKFVVLSSRSTNNDINKLLSVVKNALS